MLESALDAGALPTLQFLAEHGDYRRGVTTFPSLTPVCLTTIATGAHPDVHGIPHLVWFHRGEQRIVEYGSSFPALRAVGARQGLRDTVFNMTHAHMSPGATTVFEAVEDAGLTPAAINFTCYRGRTRHAIRLPELAARNRWYEAVYGPKRFFFFNIFESDVTGAPLAIRSRVEGSIDDYAAAIGRWLVTRNGFDFLVFYLPDYDYASHQAGPGEAGQALVHADAALGKLLKAAGDLEVFLERYAVIVCSDHGQTRVDEAIRLEERYADLRVFAGRRSGDPSGSEVAITASNRAGMVYRLPGCPEDTRQLAERLDGFHGADVVLFREEGLAVARRAGEELRFAPDGEGWRLEGDGELLDSERYPNGLERAWCALHCPNAGEVVVSAQEGVEFVDLGGQAHVGGGSHGSLLTGDSLVPMLAAGFAEPPLGRLPQTTDLAPLTLTHFGIDLPASMRARDHVGV